MLILKVSESIHTLYNFFKQECLNYQMCIANWRHSGHPLAETMLSMDVVILHIYKAAKLPGNLKMISNVNKLNL